MRPGSEVHIIQIKADFRQFVRLDKVRYADTSNARQAYRNTSDSSLDEF